MRIDYSLIVGSVIILFPTLTFSQVTDTITIHHKYYSTAFSKSKRFPIVVKYWLTRDMLDCDHRFKRKNKFKPDPLIPWFTNLDKDYKRSGYDRGHQMDAYSCCCDSIAMAWCFNRLRLNSPPLAAIENIYLLRYLAACREEVRFFKPSLHAEGFVP